MSQTPPFQMAAITTSNMLTPTFFPFINHGKFPSVSISLTTRTPTNTITCNAAPNPSSSPPSIITKTHPKTPVADMWRKIHGEENWAGLLDPMDPLMRAELIRYGEMAQACYDAFDYDPFSKYCGNSKYPLHAFFESLDMTTHMGYTLTRFLYATANINLPNFFMRSRWPHRMWSKHANWVGYVAVSDDEATKRLGRRDISVAWRGTVTRLEWVADLINFLVSISSRSVPCPYRDVKVESGFLELYTDREGGCDYCKSSAREQVLREVKHLVDKHHNEELSITMTGHSLGSALAMLSGYDVAESGLNVASDGRVVPVTVFSFSGPRVGNVRFKERLEVLGVKVLRVVNVHDLVPKLPGLLFNEHLPDAVMKIVASLPWSYSHVGVELVLDHEHSSFLNPDGDALCAHNLEAYLHLLDGYHGRGQKFELANGRDYALVNKACDFLKDNLEVPPYWRQDQNKGMIRSHDGRWVQPERPN